MTLVLFFTRNVSLQTWVQTGLLGREQRLYKSLLDTAVIDQVLWITYGSQDEEIAQALRNKGHWDSRIIVLPKPKWCIGGRLGNAAWSILSPIIYAHPLKEADILKTNQLDGGWAAVLAGYLYHKPVIARAGFIASNLQRAIAPGSPTTPFRRSLEAWTCRNSDTVVVTSEHDRQYAIEVLGADPHATRKLSNFIDTGVFQSQRDWQRRKDRFVYVGRLTKEKNLFSLIEACALTATGCDIIGAGEQMAQLKQRSAHLHADIRFLGTIPNSDLPKVLNHYRFGALTSLQEGMPKSLLEMMACGIVCVGTNVPGIREVLTDGETGFLATDCSAREIALAIQRARSGNTREIAVAAISHVNKEHSLQAIARKETLLIRDLTNAYGRARKP